MSPNRKVDKYFGPTFFVWKSLSSRVRSLAKKTLFRADPKIRSHLMGCFSIEADIWFSYTLSIRGAVCPVCAWGLKIETDRFGQSKRSS